MSAREAIEGVTAERLAQLRDIAERGHAYNEVLTALRVALRFYDLTHKAWLGCREEYTEEVGKRDDAIRRVAEIIDGMLTWKDCEPGLVSAFEEWLKLPVVSATIASDKKRSHPNYIVAWNGQEYVATAERIAAVSGHSRFAQYALSALVQKLRELKTIDQDGALTEKD